MGDSDGEDPDFYDETTVDQLREIDAALKSIEDEDVYKGAPLPALGPVPLPEEYVEPARDFIEPADLQTALSDKDHHASARAPMIVDGAEWQCSGRVLLYEHPDSRTVVR